MRAVSLGGAPVNTNMGSVHVSETRLSVGKPTRVSSRHWGLGNIDVDSTYQLEALVVFRSMKQRDGTFKGDKDDTNDHGKIRKQSCHADKAKHRAKCAYRLSKFLSQKSFNRILL